MKNNLENKSFLQINIGIVIGYSRY